MLSKNKANVFLDFFGVSFLLLTGMNSCVLTGGRGGGLNSCLSKMPEIAAASLPPPACLVPLFRLGSGGWG